MVKKGKLRWFGRVVRSSGLCKKILQGTILGQRRDGKIRSEDGPASTSTAVRDQLRTVRDGRRLSPMSAGGAPAILVVSGLG